jgi:hypothetical protein
MKQQLPSHPTHLLMLEILMVLILPLSMILLAGRPDLGPFYEPSTFPTFGWITLVLWTEPGFYIAAVISWLGIYLFSRTASLRIKLVAQMLVLVYGFLTLCGLVYVALWPVDFRLGTSIRLENRRYYVLEEKFLSGGTYQALYACNSWGWHCELIPLNLLQFGPLSPDQLEAYLRSLPKLP